MTGEDGDGGSWALTLWDGVAAECREHFVHVKVLCGLLEGGELAVVLHEVELFSKVLSLVHPVEGDGLVVVLHHKDVLARAYPADVEEHGLRGVQLVADGGQRVGVSDQGILVAHDLHDQS